MEHPEWRGRLIKARDAVIPWIERSVPLDGLTVLEYGCGQGAVSCALAPRVGRHIGVDIDPEAIALARGHLARRGIVNSELHALPADSIVDDVRAMSGEIDVVLLYAVVEHLSIEERLEVLRLAADVLRPDGHVIVCESPNRLTPVDHHTGQMAFLHMLPPALATRYYDRSPRADFVEALDAAAAVGPDALATALTRWGTGVSFHEFELVFGDLAAHTVASNYHPLLYASRPVRGEELQLAATLAAWRPDLPPCWSRSWLDTILSLRPLDAPPTHVRPWAMRLPHDVAGAAMLLDGRIELRPGAWLPVDLPAATDELHIGLMTEGDATDTLRVRTPTAVLAPRAQPPIDPVPQWHAAQLLDVPTAHLAISIEGGGCLTYVGYAGPPDPGIAHGRARGW